MHHCITAAPLSVCQSGSIRTGGGVLPLLPPSPTLPLMDLTQAAFRGTTNITSSPQVVLLQIRNSINFPALKTKMSSPINPAAIKRRIGHNQQTLVFLFSPPNKSKHPEEIHTLAAARRLLLCISLSVWLHTKVALITDYSAHNNNSGATCRQVCSAQAGPDGSCAGQSRVRGQGSGGVPWDSAGRRTRSSPVVLETGAAPSQVNLQPCS